MGRKLTSLVCAVALAAAAGCGETDEEQAREVAQDYVEASNARNFQAVCDLYSEQFIEELEATDCPAFVKENSSGADSEFSLVDVRVSEGGGPIRVGLRLERNPDDEWEIVGLQ